MEEGEFADVINEIRDILEDDYYEEDEEEDDDMTVEENQPFYYETLKNEFSPIQLPLDSNANTLLHAGYADCMEEAIRFLIEEENISPEHPVVKNLKAHLEKSKDRVLQPLGLEENPCLPLDSSPCNIFLETFQHCRDSG